MTHDEQLVLDVASRSGEMHGLLSAAMTHVAAVIQLSYGHLCHQDRERLRSVRSLLMMTQGAVSEKYCELKKGKSNVPVEVKRHESADSGGI